MRQSSLEKIRSMPPRFSYGLSSRRTSFFFNRMEDVLWTETNFFLIQSSEILPTWKCPNLPLVRILSSSRGLHFSSHSKEGSLNFSCPVENEGGINRAVAKFSYSSFPHGKKRSFNVFGSSGERLCSSVADIKEISFNGSKPTPVLFSEYAKAPMRGWNVSIVKPRGSEEWRRVWSDGRRTHMGHAHDHDGHDEKAGSYGDKVLRWGLWTDMLLTIFKGAAGYISGSTAIIADAAHSASDIVLSGVALWSSRASSAPPDKQHPYGHGKIETMGALTISGLLLATGGGIAWSAVDTLQVMVPAMLAVQDTVQTTVDTVANVGGHSHDHDHGHGVLGHTHGLDMEHMGVALMAAIVGIGAKEGLYWVTKAAGEKAGSALLTASAWHHRSDAISSVVALVGVGGAMMGVPWLDPVAALFVSGMIVKAGLETGYQSMQELLDMGLSESVLAPIRKTAFGVDGVEGIHQLRGRRMGSTVHVDVHIEVDPWLSVSAAHNIGEAVRQQLRMHHPNVTESFVHIDPADGRPTSLAPGELEVESVAADKHHYDHLRSNQNSGGNHPDRNTLGHSHVNVHDKSTGGEVEEDEHMRDLTGIGPKAETFAWGGIMSKDGREAFHDTVGTLRQSEVERCVRNVLHANFPELVKVEDVTCHFLHGNVVAEVGVSLDPKLSIRDAMQHASDMEDCLLRELKDLSAVSLHLNLSNSNSLVQGL